jgi:hypothetical protein
MIAIVILATIIYLFIGFVGVIYLNEEEILDGVIDDEDSVFSWILSWLIYTTPIIKWAFYFLLALIWPIGAVVAAIIYLSYIV